MDMTREGLAELYRMMDDKVMSALDDMLKQEIEQNRTELKEFLPQLNTLTVLWAGYMTTSLS